MLIYFIFGKYILAKAIYREGYERLQPVNKTFFELSAKDNNGNMFSFESLKSKKAIIVFNSASEWGLSTSNYNGLDALYKKYSDQGLEIVDFPSNTFNQEPRSDQQIKEW